MAVEESDDEFWRFVDEVSGGVKNVTGGNVSSKIFYFSVTEKTRESSHHVPLHSCLLQVFSDLDESLGEE